MWWYEKFITILQNLTINRNLHLSLWATEKKIRIDNDNVCIYAGIPNHKCKQYNQQFGIRNGDVPM